MDSNKNEDSLTEEELNNVLGGNSQGMGEKIALEHPELFRNSQIEDLQTCYYPSEEQEESHGKAR